MLDTGEPLLIADAGQDPRFPPEGIPLPNASPAFPTREFRCFSATADRRHAGGAGAQAGPFKPEHLTLLEFWAGRW
jgi:hypothetical protein